MFGATVNISLLAKCQHWSLNTFWYICELKCSYLLIKVVHIQMKDTPMRLKHEARLIRETLKEAGLTNSTVWFKKQANNLVDWGVRILWITGKLFSLWIKKTWYFCRATVFRVWAPLFPCQWSTENCDQNRSGFRTNANSGDDTAKTCKKENATVVAQRRMSWQKQRVKSGERERKNKQLMARSFPPHLSNTVTVGLLLFYLNGNGMLAFIDHFCVGKKKTKTNWTYAQFSQMHQNKLSDILSFNKTEN